MSSLEAGASKIDDWLPEYQVSARYATFVRSSAKATFEALRKARLSDLRIVRTLMRIRGYGCRQATATEERPHGPFIELALIPEREVVLGIAGRFWRPDGGIIRTLSAAEFRGFCREGYAKAVWNFLLTPVDGGTELSTETRIQTFGRSATLKFRAYWLLVRPFSGIIRGAMLREVKRFAEQTAS